METAQLLDGAESWLFASKVGRGYGLPKDYFLSGDFVSRVEVQRLHMELMQREVDEITLQMSTSPIGAEWLAQEGLLVTPAAGGTEPRAGGVGSAAESGVMERPPVAAESGAGAAGPRYVPLSPAAPVAGSNTLLGWLGSGQAPPGAQGHGCSTRTRQAAVRLLPPQGRPRRSRSVCCRPSQWQKMRRMRSCRLWRYRGRARRRGLRRTRSSRL
jgi:hypothetical protein